MSVYLAKGKGWRYDFILEGKRYSAAGFKTKREARLAEAKEREAIEKRRSLREKTDMVFFDLVSARLDYVQAYHSEAHYNAYRYMAMRWVANWSEMLCSEITHSMVQEHLLVRRKVSAFAANKDLRYLRATFNFGIKKMLIEDNPTKHMEFFPVEKKLKKIPSVEEVDKVLAAADQDAADYLWTIRETMARVGEINDLTWEDVNFEESTIVLYTRKKKGGHRTPRIVPMTSELRDILSRRYEARDESMEWVFWHRYWDKKEKRHKTGPFGYRKELLANLCKRAGVRRFKYHDLRRAGASLMDSRNVPIGSIQRILGHENRTTTEIYLYSLRNSEREAMAVYEMARQESHTKSHTGTQRA